MSLQRKLKTALDETRMLMMGAQILFGFQFEAVFQKGFATLDGDRKALAALGILLMAATIGILIAPSSRHRLVEQGEASIAMLRMTTGCAGATLLLFSASLGSDLVIVFGPAFGNAPSVAIGGSAVVVALGAWFLLALALRPGKEVRMPASKREGVDIATRIEQMLTEARVVLPGAQALFGFQLIAILAPAFEALPAEAKRVHAAALLCVVLTVILLMAPAAIHRLAFGGENTGRMLRLGSGLVTAALLPLSLGIAGDIFVAVGHGLESPALGLTAGLGSFGFLLVIWYGWPLLLRARRSIGTHAGATR